VTSRSAWPICKPSEPTMTSDLIFVIARNGRSDSPIDCNGQVVCTTAVLVAGLTSLSGPRVQHALSVVGLGRAAIASASADAESVSQSIKFISPLVATYRFSPGAMPLNRQLCLSRWANNDIRVPHSAVLRLVIFISHVGQSLIPDESAGT
jgi:hypothetical protein